MNKSYFIPAMMLIAIAGIIAGSWFASYSPKKLEAEDKSLTTLSAYDGNKLKVWVDVDREVTCYYVWSQSNGSIGLSCLFTGANTHL